MRSYEELKLKGKFWGKHPTQLYCKIRGLLTGEGEEQAKAGWVLPRWVINADEGARHLENRMSQVEAAPEFEEVGGSVVGGHRWASQGFRGGVGVGGDCIGGGG